MIDSATALRLTASPPVLHVSGLSSLLRTFQAAVRDAAHETDAGRMLSVQPPPVLALRFAHGPGLSIEFGFVDQAGGGLPDLDRAAFGAFMDALAAALKITPQRSLWGTPARPLVRSAGENERLKLFLEDLLRMGDVQVSCRGRSVAIRDGRIEAAES